ncbi:DUF3048 domain-containing protein [Streptomyces sp. PKU-EA00015]|uniref:DUF3048 domain-containing protein n=1 Tax=Streptomyces sp. PKU-EA00015 TaxID=2748326 RepID=UPI0015A02CAC|nr:DUF3048 domain-containing protein [Streptomyces sp. PKU-EA00015]NWF29027.1 DUF3048 domain-containing protein [Streptomyces sp. PKU-EA00015]
MKTRRGQHHRRSGGAVAALAAASLALGLFGCSDGGDRPEPTRPPTSAQQRTSYFTGLPAEPGPVLAVKIDNVRPARPHTGLDAADLVYVEQVESGLSRILAVFSSRLPPQVGPVRSARESDLELLRQFGRPALAYSGAQSALGPLIDAAPIVALPHGRAPDAYVRGSDRPAPHNLYLLPGKVLAAARGVSDASDIGLRFGAAPADGRPTAEQTVRYPSARYAFTWSAAQKRWLVAMDGTAARTTDGKRLAPATVVVQYTEVRPSKFRDRGGSVSPYTETVGSGRALVLRDGRAFDARWQRDSAAGDTVFTTAAGERLNFARGQVWILLTSR